MYAITYDINEWKEEKISKEDVTKFLGLIKQSAIRKFMLSPTAINEFGDTVVAVSRKLYINPVSDINQTLIDAFNNFEILYDIYEIPAKLSGTIDIDRIKETIISPYDRLVVTEHHLIIRGVIK